MRADKARGLKGHVVITLTNDEATGEVRLYRGGRLGLASHAAPCARLFKPIGQQLRSLPGANRRGLRGSVSLSQLLGESL